MLYKLHDNILLCKCTILLTAIFIISFIIVVIFAIFMVVASKRLNKLPLNISKVDHVYFFRTLLDYTKITLK